MTAAWFRHWPRWLSLLLAALFVLGQWLSPSGSRGEGALGRLDAVLYDWRFQWLPPEREAVLPLVIVDLDEATQQREGRWPWDRAQVADLVEAIRGHGAVLIGFDVVFSEPGGNPVARVLASPDLDPALRAALTALADDHDGDAALAEVLDPFVLLGYFFHADGGSAGLLPPPLLLLSDEQQQRLTLNTLPDYTASLPELMDSGAGAGFVVAIPDADGIVRRMPLVMRHGDGVYASLALEMARVGLGAPWLRLHTVDQGRRTLVTGVQVGRDLMVPLDEDGSLLVPYRGRAGSYTTVSATGVMRGDAPPSQLAALDGALVLVGTSALGLSDLRTTPLQTGYPGVEAHANVLDALLQAGMGHDTFYHRPDWAPGANLVLLAVLGLLLSLALPGRAPRAMLLVSGACLVLAVGANLAIWHHARLALPLAAPLLLVLVLASWNIVLGYLAANRQRRAIQSLFSEYVPAAYVARMVANPKAVSLAGEQRDMTVLFSDVRNFTALSEHLSATELKALLNRYLSAVTEVLFEHHATIDKYVGDLVMAFWNAPLDDPHHAHHAVAGALAMQRRMAALREEFDAEGLPALRVGVGLNTGSMNVGDMGSRYRRAYTVLGDAVNLASRLEGLTAFYGVDILVSADTRQQAPGFLYRSVDRIRVKGRQEVVEVYEPLCAQAEADAAQQRWLSLYEAGVALYRARRWPEAREAFETLAEVALYAALSRLYLGRMAQTDPADLPPDWAAVHDHVTK